MMTENKYPILEFDDEKVAKLNPTVFADEKFGTDKLVITFFPEIMEKLILEEDIVLERTIGGENPVRIYRFVDTDVEVTGKIIEYLEQNDISYIRGLTWTTDAMFRETPDRIAKRKEEGAKIVEMEQAGCIAVSQFRGFAYGALIYGGDDVSQDEWSERSWRSREGIRYDLVMLCKKLVEVI